jgi:hypothetical protein
MPLPSIQQSVAETLEEAKTRIEAAVVDALGQQDVVEIEVPLQLSQDLLKWVEDEGMMCGCQILPNNKSILAINTTQPPLPPRSPEEIQAEIDLAVQQAQEIYSLSARVATLEAEIASLRGGG